jgi:hypothetical protein
MITKSEYIAYSAHGCADYIEADRIQGRKALARALKTATNNGDRRVLSAEMAFTDAAHYQRLSQLDGLDEHAREFALHNVDFCRLRGRLLLPERTDEQINEAC